MNRNRTSPEQIHNSESQTTKSDEASSNPRLNAVKEKISDVVHTTAQILNIEPHQRHPEAYHQDEWTSGNLPIDNLIKSTQLEARHPNDKFLEWTPYEKLTDFWKIREGGFGEVYSAIWSHYGNKNCQCDTSATLSKSFPVFASTFFISSATTPPTQRPCVPLIKSSSHTTPAFTIPHKYSRRQAR
ncbi:4811_t:CDS:2 [Ambispora gerdemannii]|uniref:4811_t:CDS:1 n=1 Tax=Ambispora gerdemannii TaxID=144530 RepID=A0A9N9EZP8_9GLOM|nr:4811_t:CDS:2 [Ambispora gerdemannii]